MYNLIRFFENVEFYSLIKSLITSPAIIKPATEGTKLILAGVDAGKEHSSHLLGVSFEYKTLR